jgi:hypothetical protein
MKKNISLFTLPKVNIALLLSEKLFTMGVRKFLDHVSSSPASISSSEGSLSISEKEMSLPALP